MSPKSIYDVTPKDSKPEPEKIETVKEEKEEQTFVIKTELDAYVSSRLKSQPQSVDDIKFTEHKDDGVVSNLLKLPKHIKDELDRCDLTPRWVNKDKRMIDRALDIRHWAIVNRAMFPRIPKHYFTANGTVENGDLILCCMGKARAEKLRSLPGERSSERVKNLPIDRWKQSSGTEKVGYYKPAYTAERDGDTSVTGIVPDRPDNNNE